MSKFTKETLINSVIDYASLELNIHSCSADTLMCNMCEEEVPHHDQDWGKGVRDLKEFPHAEDCPYLIASTMVLDSAMRKVILGEDHRLSTREKESYESETSTLLSSIQESYKIIEKKEKKEKNEN